DVDLPEGDEITFSTGGTSANGGVVTVDPITGEYKYTPAKDFNGKDSFTITVTDKAGLTDTITIHVDVTPVNDAPTADPEQDTTTAEDTPVKGTIEADDIDLGREGDELTYTVTGNPINGTVTIDSKTGEYTYTPNPNYNGRDSFTITVTDKDGQTVEVKVPVKVTPVNDAPEFDEGQAGTDSNAPLTVLEDPTTPLTGTVTADDVDLPEGDEITFSTGGTSANGGVVTVDPITGEYKYTPAKDFNGKDSFTITVTDKAGLTDTITIHVDVTPVNDAPEFDEGQAGTDPNAPLMVLEDPTTPLTGTVTADDVDLPEGDEITFSTGGTSANGGVVTVDPITGEYKYTPAKDFNGKDSFTITVTDKAGLTDTITIHVDVTPVNDDPTANPDEAVAQEGQPFTSTESVLKNDTDKDWALQPEGEKDQLTVTTGAVTTTGGGTITFNPDGSYTYTPAEGFSGTDTVKYEISDGQGGTATGTLT
ncbi:tandem-95 repeat protein, partial [Acinetobacter sp. ANC 3832]|uniref:tandem-95 repeat protein n=1 Tax=Acinetobacter sp. ANC 3832 TaxID=1977874 RepID=UPI000B75545C